MNRKASILCFLVLPFALWTGCSSKPSADEAKKAAAVPDKIEGKAQILEESGGAIDHTLNAGGASSVYIWEGVRRYRLFLRTAAEVAHGKEYIVEGINAQKAIDELGDPDQGQHGYPLLESCAHVVRKAWPGLSFDEVDSYAAALRARVQRYPARPVFLVKRIALAPAGSVSAESKKDTNIPEVSVAADKQKTLLIEGPTVQQAPLWQPAGGTARCKVIIGPDGKIDELNTGAQLCESVPWPQFRYQPTVQAGQPVKVSTEVEVRFDPRK